MTRVLLTAFEPYENWSDNASWLALVQLTRQLPTQPKVVTRLYPVDFERVRGHLERDLSTGFDVALHVGQAPGSTAMRLEMMAVNVRRDRGLEVSDDQVLAADGPAAYRASLPMPEWLPSLRQLGIPCELSYHAGTFVCNATLYWNQYLCERHGWKTRSGFIHVPLDPAQITPQDGALPSMPAELVARGLQTILELVDQLVDQ